MITHLIYENDLLPTLTFGINEPLLIPTLPWWAKFMRSLQLDKMVSREKVVREAGKNLKLPLLVLRVVNSLTHV